MRTLGMSYGNMRRTYVRGELAEEQLDPDPIVQFGRWMEAALAEGELEPNAMALATVGDDGQPRVRFVLLKDVTAAGFAFFTNYESRKGRDLAHAPRASLAFWWPRLERQVRVDGEVAKLPAAASDAYFAERPRGSQVGAWASRQGERVRSREELVEGYERAAARFGAGPVPRPDHWGGYLLTPSRFEFWQGREDRLHDRFEYALEGGEWRRRRLAP